MLTYVRPRDTRTFSCVYFLESSERGRIEFLNVNRSKVVHDGFLRWKTKSVHANARGCWWADRRIYPPVLAPFLPPERRHKFSLFVLLSLDHHRGMPGISIVGCRVAQCTLPLQLSRRKQISNVALNKPSQWSSCAGPFDARGLRSPYYWP